MNNFGKQIAVIKPNRAKTIFESFMALIIIFCVCCLTIGSINSFEYLFVIIVAVPIGLAFATFYIIKIIITACDTKIIQIYEHGVNINNFACSYKKLKLQVSNSKLDSKLTFFNGLNYVVIRGDINPDDYNLLLNKLRTYNQKDLSTQNTQENLISIIKPNKFVYILNMIIGFIILNRYTIFNLEYDFIEYIIILSLYFVLCLLVFNRINKQKIYLYETYLKVDDFVAPYNKLTLKFSKIPFCRNILFYYLDKTKVFNCYISKKHLNMICKMISFYKSDMSLEHIKNLGSCIKIIKFSKLKCLANIIFTIVDIAITYICVILVMFLEVFIDWFDYSTISITSINFLSFIKYILILFLFFVLIYFCILFAVYTYDFFVILIKNNKIEIYEHYLKIDGYIFKYDDLKISKCKSYFGKKISISNKGDVIYIKNHLSENDNFTLMNLYNYIKINNQTVDKKYKMGS